MELPLHLSNLVLLYCNAPKRCRWNVHSEQAARRQTACLGAVCSGSTLFARPACRKTWDHYGKRVKEILTQNVDTWEQRCKVLVETYRYLKGFSLIIRTWRQKCHVIEGTSDCFWMPAGGSSDQTYRWLSTQKTKAEKEKEIPFFSFMVYYLW